MFIGLLLIAAALFLTGYNLWDEHRAEMASQKVLEQIPVQKSAAVSGEGPGGLGETEIPDYVLNPEMEMPIVEIDGNAYIGILEIPALGLSLPVMSGWSDFQLKIAPCRYSGSAYLDNMVIAGHNYRTHFGPLSRLEAGDGITFTDVDGNLFHYEVGTIEVLKPTAIEEMTGSGWDLTLFTCTLDRQSRMALRCMKSDA